jgi:preprotein translocase subunit SecF
MKTTILILMAIGYSINNNIVVFEETVEGRAR